MKALFLMAVEESLAVIAAGMDRWRDTFPSQQLLAIESIRVESSHDWKQRTVRELVTGRPVCRAYRLTSRLIQHLDEGLMQACAVPALQCAQGADIECVLQALQVFCMKPFVV